MTESLSHAESLRDAAEASVTGFRHRLLRAGVPGEEVMSHLVRLADSPRGQQEWTAWGSVRDRDELVLRLEVLARTARLEADLVDLVLFFFRSSDPGLYQPAALALGRHMRAHPRLESEFLSYAGGRDSAGPEPVRFPGGRSARRILLVRARLEGPGGGLEAFPPELGDGLARSDLAVLLLAADWAVSDLGPQEVPRIVRELVSKVLDDPDAGRDRALMGRLGGLLVTLRARDAGDPDWIRACWAGAVSGAVGPAPELPAGEAVARLRSLDELARAFAAFSDGPAHTVEEEVGGEGGWLRPGFLPERVGAWRAFLRHGCPPDLRERRRARRRLARGMRALAARRDWIRAPAEDRAETLFGLLDPLLGQRLDPPDLRQLLEAWLASEEGRTAASGAMPAVESALVSAVLPRFLTWEGGSGMDALEPGLVHRLDTEGLVRVLEMEPEPGLAPVLADALEHRFRFSLAVDSGFDPEALLLRVAAARPSGYLWRALRELVKGRAYVNLAGEAFPLAEWVDALQSDAASGSPTLDQGRAAGVRGHTGRIREELLAEVSRIADEDDLHDRLLHLAVLLSSGATGGEGLIQSFYRRLQPGADPPPFGVVADAFVQMAVGLRPQRLGQVGRLRALLADVRPEAGELARRVARTLPPPEGEAISDLILGALGDAEEALRSFALLEERSESGSLLGEGRDGLVERILEVRDLGVRTSCLVLLWRELSAGAGLDSGELEGRGLSSPAEWETAEGILSWAARQGSKMDPEARIVWESEVAGGWASLVRDAMAAGHGRRLGRLVRRPELSSIIAREDNVRLLEEVRRWLLDVYRPWDAARAVHLTRLAQGEHTGVPGWIRAAPLFVGHYGSVWLALLIGGILMLDFGDAWTTMAEVGDVRGIGYTVALGLGGAFAYITVDLRKRLRPAPEDPRWYHPAGTLLRASGFLSVCLAYTALLTSGLWFLLSGTDEVVHGAGAPLHIAVWTGFALFIGVFFGLMAKQSA